MLCQNLELLLRFFYIARYYGKNRECSLRFFYIARLYGKNTEYLLRLFHIVKFYEKRWEHSLQSFFIARHYVKNIELLLGFPHIARLYGEQDGAYTAIFTHSKILWKMQYYNQNKSLEISTFQGLLLKAGTLLRLIKLLTE